MVNFAYIEVYCVVGRNIGEIQMDWFVSQIQFSDNDWKLFIVNLVLYEET